MIRILLIMLLTTIVSSSHCQSIKDFFKRCSIPEPGKFANATYKQAKMNPRMGETDSIYKINCPQVKSLYGSLVKEISFKSNSLDTVTEVKIITTYDSTLYSRITKDIGKPIFMFGWDGIEDETKGDEAKLGHYGWVVGQLSYWVSFQRTQVYFGQEFEDNVIFLIKLNSQ